MGVGMVWIWGLKFNPHGYSSPGNRRPESKNEPRSQIPGYTTAYLQIRTCCPSAANNVIIIIIIIILIDS